MTTDKRPPGRPRIRPLPDTPAVTHLRALQARLGLSQRGMAAYLGVPVGTLRNWTDGLREPPTVLSRLITVLGTIETLAPHLHEHLMPPGAARE